MRFAAAILVFALCLGAAFYAGRFTAAPAQFNPESEGQGDPLDLAWGNFQRAQRETLSLIQSQPFYAPGQSRNR